MGQQWRRWVVWLVIASTAALASCSDDAANNQADSGSADATSGGSDPGGAAGSGSTSGGSGSMQNGSGDGGGGSSSSVGGNGSGGSGDPGAGGSSAGGAGSGAGGDSGDPGGAQAAATCEASLQLKDSSSPDHVVGDGTPDSCTHAALAAAVSQGGVITFDCGDAPKAIVTQSTIELPIDRDTLIDGDGTITLDGGDSHRIFNFYSDNFRALRTTVTLQRLTLKNGHAQGTDFTPATGDGKCAHGYKDGAGGAIFVRDGILHVIDCTFLNNQAATPGPDVGGGAIYALGSLDLTVVGSQFVGNEGANGGAVGMLQTTGTFVNDRFENNVASGTGANYVEAGCPMFNHNEQGGAGGNGGAVCVDGVEETELYFCGVSFSGNRAGAYGGAVFRTANRERRKTTFERCTIDANRAVEGGGGLYISNSEFRLADSTVSNNQAASGPGGGVRTEIDSVADIVNVTFYRNSATMALGGGLWHGGSGVIKNCTFAENAADGGPGLFSAALAPANSAGIYNTVFANNVTADPYNPMTCWHQPYATGSGNLQWPRKRTNSDIDDTACVQGITFADPELGPLSDNGGPTQTMLPANDSPALGIGGDCPPRDQRGEPRPGDGCAAGAVEPQ